ncbi:MAG: gamma-glutamyl-gamma-aminobutyrate hydrolase family protein [Verrucomicrobia bacterium]|nr:gamma-glutamyl-gamma-aminobutyrate hydrolase family protein [Verrucomicrobiota bacterium]
MKRIGLSMRIVDEAAYDESRDALAHDWARFLALALPDCQWTPIPNLGAKAAGFIQDWGLDGLVLTGGNDPGSSTLRDDTENALVREALRRRLPLFGVCRGLQMIQRCFGGPLRGCPKDGHVATRHVVRFERGSVEEGERTVNSYHALGVRPQDLAPELIATALSADGWVEGLAHRGSPMAAVQWHPERNAVMDPLDARLLRDTLGLPSLSDASAASPRIVNTLSTPFSFPPCAP